MGTRTKSPQTWDPFEELLCNLNHLGAVRDGCVRLLASPDGAGLEIGPHDFDLEVVVSSGSGRPTRRRLTEFFPDGGPQLVAVHAKMADPRDLLLATLAQIRQQLESLVKLSGQIYDTARVRRFEEEVLHAIEAGDRAAGEHLRELLIQRSALPLAARTPGGDR